MSLTVAQLMVEVGANTKPAEEGLGRTNSEVEKSGGLFGKMKGFAGDALSTLAGFVGGAVIMQGFNAVVGFATDTIHEMFSEAQNLSDAEDLLNARLKSTHDASGMSADAINTLADSMSQMSGVSKSTILQGDNMLLTFTNIGKDVFPQASQAMLDLAISMNHGKAAGADLQSSAIQLGKALDDPIKGITALSRVGVTFTQAQKDMIKHFMEMGDKSDAQKIILQELQREFGGTAQAAGSTFGGALDKLKNTIVDFGAGALMKIEAWIQPWVTAFANWLPGALDKAGQFIGQFAQNIGGLFKSIGGAGSGFNFGGIVKDLQSFGATIASQVLPIGQQLVSWFKSDMLPAIQSVVPVVVSLAQTFVNNVVPAFITVEQYVATAATTIAKLLLPIFEKVEPIVVRLTGYILDLANKAIKFLMPYVQQAFQALSQFATEIGTRLQPFIEKLTTGIQIAAQIIQAVWTFLWPWMSAVLKTAWDIIVGVIKVAWDLISGIFKVFADLLSGNWGQLWKDIQDIGKNVWNDVKGFIGTIWKDIQHLWDVGTGYLSTVWGNIWTGIKNIASNIWDDIKGIIRNGINGAIDIINGFIDLADKVPGVNIPHIGHVNFAAGGLVPGGVVGWAGEHGPEPVFAPGSYILNNSDAMKALAGASGGGGGNIILNGPTSEQLMQMLSANQAKQKALSFGGRR